MLIWTINFDFDSKIYLYEKTYIIKIDLHLVFNFNVLLW